MPKKTLPPQHQKHQPGIESEMYPLPESLGGNYKPANKLKGKTAIITGGDSGIGRAVAFCYALEGANIVFTYLNEKNDATVTEKIINDIGSECLSLKGDLGKPKFSSLIVQKTLKKFGKIDILVNNAGEQHPQKDFVKISDKQIEQTFKTNILAYFYLTKAVLPHLKEKGIIINTTSVTAYHGHPKLVDYSATKGAIVTFTRSLALNLAEKGIRVNGVAPGPVWTPLIPSTFSADEVKKFGGHTPMKRPGQPKEIAPCYVFLACDDSSYMSGQILHPNGGQIVNG